MNSQTDYFERDGLRFDAREKVTIPLRFPVALDGRRVEEITLRRSKLKDSLKAEKVTGTNLEKGAWMLSALSGEPAELLHELDSTDLALLEAQFEAFTAGRR